MSNEKVVEKIPFDVLEVGCKYESRCGEIWEVSYKSTEVTLYPFIAQMGDTEQWFTTDGQSVFDCETFNDLIFKIVESRDGCGGEGNATPIPSNDKSQDAINPSHYKHNGIETIDYMKAVSTKEEFKGHLRLTAIKYISLLGKKDCPKQEIKKAIWYLNKLLEEYEAESNE